jgi:glycosyltransferase involved in cell wall biosynthesis
VVLNARDWSAIVIAAVPYDGSTPLGCWQVSRVLGERRPVLYVEPPQSIARGAHLPARVRPAGDGSMVQVLRPVAPPAFDRRFAGDVADPFIALQVRSAAARLKGPRAMLVFTPRRGLLRVPNDVLLYWQRDAVEMLARRGNAARLSRRHELLLRRADVVTAVSPELITRTAAAGREATLVPNGCDYTHFSTPQPRPSMLPEGRTVVGFGGGVSDRLDVALLLSLVDARPEWSFVVVGEIAMPLPERPNLLVVGRRPYWEMPAWLQAFDVGIIPYNEDTQNLHSNPLKALEYLAAGTPVVSVSINGLGELSPAVRLASGTPAFLETIDDVVKNPVSPEQCRAVARGQSWATRVDVVEQLVTAALEKKRAQ